jgi:chromosome segregation ATPase
MLNEIGDMTPEQLREAARTIREGESRADREDRVRRAETTATIAHQRLQGTEAALEEIEGQLAEARDGLARAEDAYSRAEARRNDANARVAGLSEQAATLRASVKSLRGQVAERERDVEIAQKGG